MTILSEQYYIERDTMSGKQIIPAYDTDKFGVIPQKIFKYLDLSKGYNMSGLLCGYLWFSDPSTFNDPFDCTTPFAYNLLSEDENFCKRYYQDFSMHAFPYFSENQREQFVNDNVKFMLARKNDRSYFEDLYNKFDVQKQTEAIKEFGILSTCMVKENILLWSHYADQHKGVCVQFNTNSFLELLDKPALGEVKYSEFPLVYPPFKYDLSEINESFRHIFLTKAPFWGYELEYRIFLHPIVERRQYYQDSLEVIYLGMNTSSENRKFIVEICEQSDGKIKLFQAKKTYLKFELQFEEIHY
jgi:hypothetical protein